MKVTRLLAGFVVAASLFSVAASNTVSYSDLHNVKTITILWNNVQTVGTGTGTNDLVCVVTSKVLAGSIERVVIQGSSWSWTNAVYDVTLADEDGIDLLAGKGASVSKTTAFSFCPTNPVNIARPVSFESKLVATFTNFAAATTNTGSGGMKIYYIGN